MHGVSAHARMGPSALLSRQRGNEVLVCLAHGPQGIKQSCTAFRPQGVNHQIPRFIARNAHPICSEPKLGRNAHGLAVAMIEDAGCEGFHRM